MRLFRIVTLTLTRALVFLGIVFALTIINLFWLLPGIRNIRASASLLSLEIADRVRSNASAYLQGMIDDVRLGAEEIAIDSKQSEAVFRRLFKVNPAFRSIALVDKNGNELSHVDRFSFITPKNFQNHAKEAYFYLALEGTSNFGNVFISRELEPQIKLAVPVSLFGRAEKILVLEVNLRSLINVISVKFKKGEIYIVDHEGFLIAHEEVTKLLSHVNLSSRPIISKVIFDGKTADGLAPEDDYINDANERVFAVGLPVPLFGWGVFFEQPRKQALGQERQMKVFAGTTLIGGILLFVIVLWANIRQAEFTLRLRELLNELNETAKILIRRDLELTRANDRLRDLDVMKSEFVSVAAHQLRTPLTGIKWAYYSLLDKDTGELAQGKRNIVEEGLRATERMIDLVNSLLNVARIEEGRFGLSFKIQSFTSFLQKLSMPFAQLAKDKGIVLVVDVPLDDPLLMNFDEDKLSMAIENLLDNAVKYTLPGGTVTVRAALHGKNITLDIVDTGIGILPDQLPRIFTKFFRGDNAVRLQTAGTGLGLYVTKNIVEGHRGDIEVKSEEGKGTTFSLTLPAASWL